MKIAAQTKENFNKGCFSQSAVARSLGISTATFSQVVNGKYPNLGGKEAKKALAWLKEHGLLVLEEDDVPPHCTVAQPESVAITCH